MEQNDMKHDATTFQLFCSYVDIFKTAKLTDPNDYSSKIVHSIIRPCYLNLIGSSLPPFGELDTYNISSKLTVTIKSLWTKTFNFFRNKKLEFPMFQKNTFNAWADCYFPEFQKDLALKTDEHIKAMYSAAIEDIMGTHSKALKGSLLRAEMT